MDLGYANRTVLITGASGGIGRALAEAFAAEGARVAAHAHRHGKALERWLARRPWRDRACVVTADLRRPEEAEAAFGRARERLGAVEVCVANAGARPSTEKPFAERTPAEVRETLDANLAVALWTARAFLRGLAPASRGAALLFIGSTAAAFGERGYAVYATAKAGLYGLVRTLKNEIVRCDPEGRVNLLEPGWTRTHVPRLNLEDAASVRRALRTMALRRVAEAEDIARTAVFLCSSAARHITGRTLTVAGGMEGRILWENDEIPPRREP